jgi:hypothetical protein
LTLCYISESASLLSFSGEKLVALDTILVLSGALIAVSALMAVALYRFFVRNPRARTASKKVAIPVSDSSDPTPVEPQNTEMAQMQQAFEVPTVAEAPNEEYAMTSAEPASESIMVPVPVAMQPAFEEETAQSSFHEEEPQQPVSGDSIEGPSVERIVQIESTYSVPSEIHVEASKEEIADAEAPAPFPGESNNFGQTALPTDISAVGNVAAPPMENSQTPVIVIATPKRRAPRARRLPGTTMGTDAATTKRRRAPRKKAVVVAAPSVTATETPVAPASEISASSPSETEQPPISDSPVASADHTEQ